MKQIKNYETDENHENDEHDNIMTMQNFLIKKMWTWVNDENATKMKFNDNGEHDGNEDND